MPYSLQLFPGGALIIPSEGQSTFPAKAAWQTVSVALCCSFSMYLPTRFTPGMVSGDGDPCFAAMIANVPACVGAIACLLF